MSTSITFSDQTRWKQLGDAAKREAKLLLRGAAEDLVARTTTNLRNANAVAFGQLVSSYQVVEIGGADLHGFAVGSPLDYAGYVEFGQQPHMPPMRPIYAWVEEKLNYMAAGIKIEEGKVTPTGRGKYRFGKKRSMKRARRIYELARRVAHAIARRGVKPRYAMRMAIESLGVPYRETNVMTGILGYEIDAIALLEKMGLWERVKGAGGGR